MGALHNNSYSYNTPDFAKKILFDDTSIGWDLCYNEKGLPW